MSGSQAAVYRQLIRRVTLPVAAVVVLLLCSLLATVLAVAWYQTDVARSEQARLAQGAVKVRGAHIENSAFDYGAWDEAVKNVVATSDLDWIDANIGFPAHQNLGLEMSLVVRPDNSVAYAMVGGRRTVQPLGTLLSGGFIQLLDRQRGGDPTGSTSGLVLAKGRPAIAAVVPIRPFDRAKVTGAPQHLLVFVEPIDASMLDAFAQIYLLPGLHLETAPPSADAFVPLVAMDGSNVGALVWNGARPGDSLLRTAVPVWVVLTLGFGILTALIFRQAKAAARLIGDSERRATHDALTGLPNRVLLFERLDRASLALASRGPGFAVVYLDLDGFKAVNDTHGHDAGDEVLRHVALRMSAGLGADDFVARLGGDEFAMILAGRSRPHEIQGLCQAMIEMIERPIPIGDGRTAFVSATIGVTFAPADGADPLVLLRNADQALYIGKRCGKGQVRFHLCVVNERVTAG